MASTHRLSGLALLWQVSCGQGAPAGLPSDIEWRSEHFVYHARAQDPDVCPALLARMERHFDVIRSAVGLPWPEGRVIHYYKFLDRSDYEAAAGCPEHTNGCARDGNAYAFEPFHEHELIHTYFAPLGSPPRVLSEGVAELLSCTALDLLNAANAGVEASGAAMNAAQGGAGGIQLFNPERDAPYVMGSILVSHLVKTYGWEAFLDLYAEGWQRRDAAELEQNLQTIYGASFDSNWDETMRTAPVTSCVAAWACASDPLVAGTSDTPGDSCADSAFRDLTPTEPRVLQLETDGPAAALLGCPADPGQPISGPLGYLDVPTFADLVQGTYFVVTAGDTTLTSQRLEDSMFGTQCSELGSVALEPPKAEAAWLFEPRTSPYFLRLDLPGGTQLSLLSEGTGPIQICPSCDASDECVSVDGAGTFAVRSGVVLHFPARAQPGQLAHLSLSAR